MELDMICMNFVESLEFIKKILAISIERQEEKLDMDFEDMVRNYSDSKEYFTQKKSRVNEAANTMQVSCGTSDVLCEKYEKMFLDEVYENQLEANITGYWNSYKKCLFSVEIFLGQ